MVERQHLFGRLVFDRDAIVHAALRAYVEACVARLPCVLGYPVCKYSVWTGDVQDGALRHDDGCGDYEVVAWTDAGVVGLAYELESADAAAALFVDHPHITVFPGDGVDVMPFLTGPDWMKHEAESES
jgi:hypothetical protein